LEPPASGGILRRSLGLVAPDYFSTKSAHLGTDASAPHGMIGTLDVEFFGEPSISLSE
jgi:hypothetical protein